MQENEITNFGATLTEIREEKGFTLEQLAQSTGIYVGRLINYEKDIERPNLDKLALIATVLKVSPREIINRSLDKSKHFQKAS